MKRLVKHILKYSNKDKLNWLERLYEDYKEAVQICIDKMYFGEFPIKQFMTSKELPEVIGNISPGRWRQLIYKQASEIIRGTIAADLYQKRERYKEVYKYFKKKNRQKKFLEKHFHELNLKKYSKPVMKTCSIVMDYRFTNFKEGNSFDQFMQLSLPYFQEGKKRLERINLPIKLNRRDEKFKDWKRKDCVIIEKINENFYATFIYEKETPELKAEGETIGIDFGIKKLLSTSRGEFIGTEIEKICQEITKHKKGSKNYKQILKTREQYINKSLKELDLSNVNRIFIEDLKDLKRNSKKRGKSTRKFRNKFQYCSYVMVQKKLSQICEEQGIDLVKVSPRYTSQTCSRCGAIDKASRNGENYHCKTCGYEIDADYNGALNILHRGVCSPSNTGKLKLTKFI